MKWYDGNTAIAMFKENVGTSLPYGFKTQTPQGLYQFLHLNWTQHAYKILKTMLYKNLLLAPRLRPKFFNKLTLPNFLNYLLNYCQKFKLYLKDIFGPELKDKNSYIEEK
jgi:hypothetical protein